MLDMLHKKKHRINKYSQTTDYVVVANTMKLMRFV